MHCQTSRVIYEQMTDALEYVHHLTADGFLTGQLEVRQSNQMK